MEPTLSTVESLARQAGEILRRGYGQQHQIHHKGAIDLVTEIDHQSEAFLLGEIRRLYPDHKVVAEESGALPGNDCCVWYIDPLDGAVNYAHGVPFFSVSLAYQENGVVFLGAIYDPLRDECFSAQHSRGAWLNGTPIHASETCDLQKSLLVTGFPDDIQTRPENNLAYYTRFTMLTQGVRRLGSAALDLCYVASGRLEGYCETRLNALDVAAGGLVAEQAGALVTDLYGQGSYLIPPYAVLAANRHIHPLMVEVFKEIDTLR